MPARDVRPDWRTHGIYGRHTALAAHDATCSHGTDVVEHEPIALAGAHLDQDPDGSRTVDLTAADWHPQTCTT